MADSAWIASPAALARTDTTEWGRLQKPAAAISENSPQMVKLRQAAQEFESMLLHSWWRSMQQSFGDTTSEDGVAGANILGDLGLQAMSAAITASGGLGLAGLLLQERKIDAFPETPSPGG